MNISYRLSILCSIVLLILGARSMAQATPDYDALVQQGKAQLQAGSNDAALASANAAIKLDASRWEAYAVAGGALINLKRCGEAKADLNEAIKLAPDAKQSGLRILSSQCVAPSESQTPPQAQTPGEPLTPTVDDTVAWINRNLKDGALSIRESDLVFHQDGDPSPDPSRGVTAPNGLAGLNIDTRIPIAAIDADRIEDNGHGTVTMQCRKNMGTCIASTWKDDDSADCPAGDRGQKQHPVPACTDGYHDADGNPTAPGPSCDVYGRCAQRSEEMGIDTSTNDATHVLKAVQHLVRLLQQQSQPDLF